MARKFVGDPAGGRGGLQTKGESKATKAALSHAKNSGKASAMGRKG